MAHNPLTAQPFMAERHLDVIAPLDAAVTMDISSLTEMDARERMIGSVRGYMQASGLLKREVRQVSRGPAETDEEFEHLLQLGSLTLVTKDRLLQMLMQTTATLAGEAIAEGDTEGQEKARELGSGIIIARAQSGLTELLAISDMLLDRDESQTSTWERTLAAHRKRRLNSPGISKRHWVESRELAHEAREQDVQEGSPIVKPGRSKLVTGLRMARFMKKHFKAVIQGSAVDNLNILNMMLEAQTSQGLVPLELNEDTISRVTATLRKTMKHVKNAAVVDPEIGADASARALNYLVPQLAPGFATRTEHGAFDRIATAISEL